VPSIQLATIGTPAARSARRHGAHLLSEVRTPSMPKPAQSADVQIFYQGAVFAIDPRTAAGQEWLANTVPDQPPGAVRVPLRYLDQVLSSAHRACIRLDVPWD
jgi:hypothetical protein